MTSPELLLFLTVVLGVLLGRVKWSGFSLGTAAGTLIVGTAIGALVGAGMPDFPATMKSVAFLFFVFAVGFQSGPHFFASLGRSTLPQAVLSFVIAAVGLTLTIGAARFLSLDRGTAVGLAAGSLTQTAMLGTAYGAMEDMGLSPSLVQQLEGRSAVVFAITYVIGTIGVILFCSQIGPRLIRVNLKQAARKLEAAQDAPVVPAGAPLLDFRSLVARVFRAEGAAGLTLAQVNTHLGRLAAVERVRRDNHDLELRDDLRLQHGDLVAVEGYRSQVVAGAGRIGPEVSADELVTDLMGENVSVAVGPKYTGLTLKEAAIKMGSAGHGTFVCSIRRNTKDVPVTAFTVLLPGDIITLAGARDYVARAAATLGVVVHPGHRADVAYLAGGLLCGVLIGLLTLRVQSIPITLSAGGGALVSGLIFGWWQARHPRINVPQSATQLMWDLGLATFCALVGLAAGPRASSALQGSGASVLLASVIITLTPQLVGLLVGYFILKINPVLLMGALAGAQTQDAAMLAASDVAESPAPALGFTVPYAISNIVLTMLGPAIVVMT